MESWFVNEGELDDEQYNIKSMSLKNSYIVKGGAGSGKTVLALWRMIEILAQEEDCILIVYTRALKEFIFAALEKNPVFPISARGRVMTEREWILRGRPKASHIIIDEVQDFSSGDIDAFRDNATNSIALFGDSAQKLYTTKHSYDSDGQDSITLSIEEIAKKLRLPVRSLNRNHRLPKKIARFAETMNPEGQKLEHQCRKEGTRVPMVVNCSSSRSEIDWIISLINSRGLTDVGILLPNNDSVMSVYAEFIDREIPCELKYKKQDTNRFTLDFSSDNPKIMTYHSAKGLQFQYVFLPFCTRLNSDIRHERPFYVACTRASEELFVTYAEEMHSYISKIPADFYDNLDIRKTAIR
ncbi:MAG TPA: hypothetical protein DIW47_06100 [Bacteroidetes bacterium]|nr:hypothetical protein [Bacteroidota bacterium]